jgi:hypothetical protein
VWWVVGWRRRDEKQKEKRKRSIDRSTPILRLFFHSSNFFLTGGRGTYIQQERIRMILLSLSHTKKQQKGGPERRLIRERSTQKVRCRLPSLLLESPSSTHPPTHAHTQKSPRQTDRQTDTAPTCDNKNNNQHPVPINPRLHTLLMYNPSPTPNKLRPKKINRTQPTSPHHPPSLYSSPRPL